MNASDVAATRPAALDPAVRTGYEEIVRGLARDDKKTWWERYLKGAIDFRGIPMPALRAAVLPWFAEATGGWPRERRMAAAIAFLGERYAEDKLAGVLLLESYAGDVGAGELEAIAERFRAGQIADWNTTDWLAVKALSRVAARDEDCRDRIISWALADNEPLWLRRAGLVAFVPIADGRLRGVPPTTPTLLEAAASLARDDRRFAQTAVGWLLRELSRTDEQAVRQFVETQRTRLSAEAVSMALARIEGRTGADRRRQRRSDGSRA